MRVTLWHLDPQLLIEILVLLAVATVGVAIFEWLQRPTVADFLVPEARNGYDAERAEEERQRPLRLGDRRPSASIERAS